MPINDTSAPRLKKAAELLRAAVIQHTNNLEFPHVEPISVEETIYEALHLIVNQAVEEARNERKGLANQRKHYRHARTP